MTTFPFANGSLEGNNTLTIGLNFAGTTLSESELDPSDTHGAVGLDHIVELNNGRYKVYDKDTGAEVQNSTVTYPTNLLLTPECCTILLAIAGWLRVHTNSTILRRLFWLRPLIVQIRLKAGLVSSLTPLG